MHDLMTIPEMKGLAEDLAKSGVFKIKSKEQGFALMALCQSEGVHPVQAMRRYHLIQDRDGGIELTMRADAMLAEFQARGGICQWIQTDDEICIAEFSHPTYHPKPLPIKKELQTYIDNGVALGRENRPKENWRKFPDAMLRARAISAGIRAVLPGVVVGIYATEEMDEREIPVTVDAASSTAAVRAAKAKAAETKPAPTPAAAPVVKDPPIEADFTPVAAPVVQDPVVVAPAPEAPAPEPVVTVPPVQEPVAAAPAAAASVAPVTNSLAPIDQGLLASLATLKDQVAFFNKITPSLKPNDAEALKLTLRKAPSDAARAKILATVAAEIGWRAA